MPGKILRSVHTPGKGVTFIYSDEHAGLFSGQGQSRITRASFVEPTEDGRWTADMSPVANGIILGPFVTRQEALDAETAFLERRLFGNP